MRTSPELAAAIRTIAGLPDDRILALVASERRRIQREARLQIVRDLRANGKTVSEIAGILETTEDAIKRLCERHRILSPNRGRPRRQLDVGVIRALVSAGVSRERICEMMRVSDEVLKRVCDENDIPTLRSPTKLKEAA